MDWEYVALSWRTKLECEDEDFLASFWRLDKAGWEEFGRASWQRPLRGGACIMRRPKDEARVDTAKTVGKAECLGRLWTRTQIENIALNMVLKHAGWGDRASECPDLDIEAAKEARGDCD